MDVFFVISGFLITLHLLREIHGSGTVSIQSFWARRIRRLLPAAFTVLIGSLVAAFLFLPRALLQQTLVEIGASAIYLQNWLLATNSVDYLAADNAPSLVQHYWSLAVEEQFYILWPLLISGSAWVAFKLRRNPQNAIAIALTVVLAMSLAFSIYETVRSQPSAYFITPTRAWEFAAGGLLAFAPVIAGLRSARIALSWFGLGLIGVSAVMFDAATAFPGYAALLPVVGTMLVLFARESELRWSITPLLGLPPVQFIGDISYAVYLWHWPIIVLNPYIFGRPLTTATKILILGATLILAAGTKYLVEDPARRVAGRARQPLPAFAFMVAGVCVIVGASSVGFFKIEEANQIFALATKAAIGKSDGCFGAVAMVPANNCLEPHAVTDTVDPAFASRDPFWHAPSLQPEACNSRPDSLITDCEFGEIKDPKLTIALVGDSHAQQFLDPLITYGRANAWRIIPLTRPGCSGIETRLPLSNTTSARAKCIEWGNEIHDELMQRPDIDVVVFSNYTSAYDVTAKAAATYWRSIRATGKAVIALRDIPRIAGGAKGPACVEAHRNDYDPCAWVHLEQGSDFMVDASSTGAAMLVDLTRYLCDEKCHVVIGGTIAYYDGNHFTYTFSKTLPRILGQSIELAILNAKRFRP